MKAYLVGLWLALCCGWLAGVGEAGPLPETLANGANDQGEDDNARGLELDPRIRDYDIWAVGQFLKLSPRARLMTDQQVSEYLRMPLGVVAFSRGRGQSDGAGPN